MSPQAWWLRGLRGRASGTSPRDFSKVPNAVRNPTIFHTRGGSPLLDLNNLKARRTRLMAFAALLGSVLAMSTCFAQSTRKAEASNLDEESIRKLFQTRDNDKSTQYLAVFRDLNDDGIPEAIVYLMGQQWCGSGGCNLYILQKRSSSWKTVTSMTITNAPIRILDRKVNGWHSLGVWVQGGGIQPGYEAELRFNGKTYPRNPSVPPARRAAKGLAGKVVIKDTDNPKPLW